jgi:hypothetical protein
LKRSDHCKRALETFGEEFDHVHAWLDELFRIPGFSIRHRAVRHNWKGVERVREKWGDIAAEVAKQHILDDMGSAGDPAHDESCIAEDADDYKKRGYF